MEERMILMKVAYGFSCFYGRDMERKQYILHLFIIENVELRLIKSG